MALLECDYNNYVDINLLHKITFKVSLNVPNMQHRLAYKMFTYQ